MSLLAEDDDTILDAAAPPREVIDRRPCAPRSTRSSTTRARRFRRLRLGLAAVCVLAAVEFAFESAVSGIMFDRRQSHLAADYSKSRPTLPSGAATAVLQVPQLGLNVFVVEDASVSNLRGGPAHQVGTPLPGKPGNSIIVGHHRRYGAPFKALEGLKAGDVIVVKARNAAPVSFTVQTIEHPKGNSSVLLGPTKDARLTLVSGTGARFSSALVIVQATADPKGAPMVGEAVALKSSTDNAFPLMGLADVAFVVAVLAFGWINKRYPRWVAWSVAAPLAALSLVGFLLFVDQLLPALS